MSAVSRICIVFLALLLLSTLSQAAVSYSESDPTEIPSGTGGSGTVQEAETLESIQPLVIMPTPSTPKQLKLDAKSQLLQTNPALRTISGSSLNASSLQSIASDLNRSASQYYADENHLPNNKAFSMDANAFKKLDSLKTNADAATVSWIIGIQSTLFKADDSTISIYINEAIAQRSAIPLRSGASSDFKTYINAAKSNLATAQSLASQNKFTSSVAYLTKAWNKADAATTILDKKTKPIVTVSLLDPNALEDENTWITATVKDIRWYALTSAKLQTISGTQSIPLEFDFQNRQKKASAKARLSPGSNAITVSYTGAYALTGSQTLSIAFDADGLPDVYEQNTTHTNPLSKDSDNDGIPDGQEDLENDDLTNVQEFLLQTNPLQADSDGDGLLDGFEAKNSLTNPTIADSQTPGTMDSQLDADADGLTNIEEQTAQNNALSADNDQLTDDSEIKLGANPLQSDSDGDGIADGLDQFVQFLRDSNNQSSLLLDGIGDVQKQSAVSLNELAPTAFQDNPSIVSTASYFFKNPVNAQSITLSYDPTRLNGVPESELQLMYYDPTTNGVGLLENVQIDTMTNKITGTVPSIVGSSTLSVGKISAQTITQPVSVQAQFFAVGFWPSMADYQVWQSSWKKPTIVFKPGDRTQVKVVVKNIGAGNASSATVSFYRNGNQNDIIGSANLPALSNGGNTTVTLSWSVSAGTSEICALADSSNLVIESIESNNARCEDFSQGFELS